MHSALLTLVAFAFMLGGYGLTEGQTPKAPTLCTSSPVLHHRGKTFWLQLSGDKGNVQRLEVPREWLMPAKEVKEEEDAYVSSFNYDRDTTCFAIGNGQLGIRVSSFSIQKEGSAHAAAGRDVFFVVEPRARKLKRGLDLGITKQRLRSEGCMSAIMSHFVLADINQDGLTDIGVVREQIQCPASDYGESEHPTDHGPVYRQLPIAWYVESDEGWKVNEQDAGKLPTTYTELPINMILSPVDFVGGMFWHTYDRNRWPHVGGVNFVPAYLKPLLAPSQQTKVQTQAHPWVEMAYCGAKPQKPPLARLYFHVSLHNPTDQQVWLLLPMALYSQPKQPRNEAGIYKIEVLSDENKRIHPVQFNGTRRSDPDVGADAGGFQAFLLPPGVDVTVRRLSIDFWGRPEGSLPITVVVASRLMVRGRSVEQLFPGIQLSSSAGTTEHLSVTDSWETPDLGEVPLTITQTYKFAIENAFAETCESKVQ
jgi:hypothetical protein